MPTNLYYKFYSGLKEKHNLTKQQFVEGKFVYIGKLKYNSENESHEPDNYLLTFMKHYKNKLKLLQEIKAEEECVCGVSILKNCVLYSNDLDKFLLIGSCCCESFNETKKQKLCEICKEPHKKYKSLICDNCKLNETINLPKVKKYKKCKKCGNAKTLDKYFWCLNCNMKDKIYLKCESCGISKNTDNDRKYKYCFSCNKITNNIKSNNIII